MDNPIDDPFRDGKILDERLDSTNMWSQVALVDELERALADARAGRIHGIVAVGITGSGDYSIYSTISHENGVDVLFNVIEAFEDADIEAVETYAVN